MRKKPNRIIEAITGLLPVSRKAYKEDLRKLLVIIKGIKQSEIQHTQVETKVLQTLGAMQVSKAATTKKEDDIAFR